MMSNSLDNYAKVEALVKRTMLEAKEIRVLPLPLFH